MFQVAHIVDMECNLSELLDSVEYIPLETNDNSLLSGLSKILFIKDYIYASSQQEVMKFDGNGRFIGKLSKFGNGPQDYYSINDYDIVLRNGNEEIWVGHQNGISCYDAENFSFLGMIPLGVPVLHFKYLSDNTIIIQTSGEYSFCLCDKNGVSRNYFLPNDPANLSHSLMQFVMSEDGVFNILAGTDEAVCYNEKSDSLELVRYINGIDNILTRDDNRIYMEKYGFLEQPRKVSQDFVNVVTFRKKGNNSILFLRSGKGEKMLVNRGKGYEWESYDIYPKPTISNNLLEGLDVRYLLTMASCDSDKSFMMSVPAYVLSGVSVNGQIIDDEDNPVIVKYKLK